MSGAAGGLPLPPALRQQESQQQSISSATWSGRGPAARRESVGRDAPVEEASGLTLGALGLTLGDATPGVFRDHGAPAPRPAPPPPQEDEEDAGGALTLEALGLSIEDTAAPETGNTPTIFSSSLLLSAYS